MRRLIVIGGILILMPSFCIAESYGSNTAFQGNWSRMEPIVRGKALGPPLLSPVEEIKLGYEPEAEKPDAEGHREPAYGPVDFDVDKEGNIYIADTEKQRVVKFDKKGKYFFSIDRIDENSYLEGPGSIAIDGKGNIYVADSSYSTRNCILKFDSQGKFVKKIEGVNGRKFTWITDLISLYYNGNIYVRGEIEGREKEPLIFYEFDSDGNFVRETRWSSEDKRGNGYQCKVIDGKPINNILKIVSPAGEVIKEIVIPLGQKEGEEPGCIEIDREGNSYFMDYAWGKMDEIFKYDNDGNLIIKFKVKSLHTNTIAMRNMGFKILPNGTIYQMHASDEGLRIIKYEPDKTQAESPSKDKVKK